MSVIVHDHDGTNEFDPTCQRCRDGWQAAFDGAQCAYLEPQFSTEETPPDERAEATR